MLGCATDLLAAVRAGCVCREKGRVWRCHRAPGCSALVCFYLCQHLKQVDEGCDLKANRHRHNFVLSRIRLTQTISSKYLSVHIVGSVGNIAK